MTEAAGTSDDGVPIVRLAARGDGVTANGLHVPMAAPGDRLLASGDLVRGPHHRLPQCPHFAPHSPGGCGGCALQHIDDAAYSNFLIARVADALTAQGVTPPEILPPHLSPPYARRRASLTAERKGRGVIIGYSEGASHNLVDLRACPVLHPRLTALIAPLRALLLTAMADRSRTRITLTQADQGIDCSLAGRFVEGFATEQGWIDFAQAHDLARLTVDGGDGPETRYAPVPPTITLSGRSVCLPPGAFLQATPDGEAALIAAVRDWLGEGQTIADLFAGLGTFTLALPTVRLAAEGQRDACAALARAAPGVRIAHRDLFRQPYGPEELGAFDAIVLDPPRAGAVAQVERLAKSRVARIAYVSCNPATFARDARTLIAGGYILHMVRPVGQFRWSTHVELMAGFSRSAKSG